MRVLDEGLDGVGRQIDFGLQKAYTVYSFCVFLKCLKVGISSCYIHHFILDSINSVHILGDHGRCFVVHYFQVFIWRKAVSPFTY